MSFNPEYYKHYFICNGPCVSSSFLVLWSFFIHWCVSLLETFTIHIYLCILKNRFKDISTNFFSQSLHLILNIVQIKHTDVIVFLVLTSIPAYDSILNLRLTSPYRELPSTTIQFLLIVFEISSEILLLYFSISFIRPSPLLDLIKKFLVN